MTNLTVRSNLATQKVAMHRFVITLGPSPLSTTMKTATVTIRKAMKTTPQSSKLTECQSSRRSQTRSPAGLTRNLRVSVRAIELAHLPKTP